MKIQNLLFVLLALALMRCTPDSQKSKLKFAISFTKEMSDQAQDGRLLIIHNNDSREPRQINEG